MSADERNTASPLYALGQLERALRTATEHPDEATRASARAKIERWRAVISGMADGTLTVGSRTPVANTPAWVTLEVAHGGFATGRYLAEGELREHESLQLEQLPEHAHGTTDRERLNLFFLSDKGLSILRNALQSGCYDVDLPEEAALLVALWLMDNGCEAQALDLIAELRPLMHRLRFYPRLRETPRSSGAGVHVATTKSVRDGLLHTKPSVRVSAMNRTLAAWNPLYDALVSLWLRTVEGESPTLLRKGGALVRDEKGQPVTEGGWPGRRWPSDWSTARDLWLAQYQAALDEHGPSGRHHARKSNFQVLRRLLEKCPGDAAALTEKSIAVLRHALACAVHKHGPPASERASLLRAEQSRVASLPLHSDIAAALATRLAKYPQDEGLGALDSVTGAVAAGEHPQVPAGTEIPSRFCGKLERALLAPVDELVERGVIGSAEVLAIVLPQLTSQVAAAGIEDRTCRDLFGCTYAAFRRRRSLLLLDLEHQVSLEELPWIAALAPLRRNDIATTQLASQTFRDLALLTIEHFPHTIIPNPLLREFVALATGARLELPFVEEIAADIFMGTFTKKFSDAAQIASKLLEGSVYARYYDLPLAKESRDRPQELLSRWGKQTDPSFDALCAARAKEAGTGGGPVAQNGAVLEQMQILTSYNLATLVEGLDLHRELERRGEHLAKRTLRWAFSKQARLPEDYLPRLRSTKNTAYAWRQAVFFLSFVELSAQQRAVNELIEEFAEKDPATFARLQPALAGLAMIVGGGRFDESGRGPAGERRFLGWALGRHWLLADSATAR